MIIGDSLDASVTTVSDTFFLFFYTTELSMKLIYIPWFFGEDAIYNDPYNMLDLLVVISSLIDYSGNSSD